MNEDSAPMLRCGGFVYVARWDDEDSDRGVRLTVYDAADLDDCAGDVEELQASYSAENEWCFEAPHPNLAPWGGEAFCLATATWLQYHGQLYADYTLPPERYAEGRALVRQWFDHAIAHLQGRAAAFGPPPARVIT